MRIVLKVAMLFAFWQGDPFRPTRDPNWPSLGDHDPAAVAAIIRSTCTVNVPEVGVVFEATGGAGECRVVCVCVRTTATITGTRLHIQIDVGFGDVITPEPIEIEYPAIPDSSASFLRAYPPETVVSEKTEAIVSLGFANIRM